MSNKAKPLSKKAQGEETRATLIQTGSRLFAINGYHGVSMRTLAAEAGVNLATVSYHFGGKAGLYEAILRQLIAVRDEFFPSDDAVRERAAKCPDSVQAKQGLVRWFVNALVHGILGGGEHFWSLYLITRELAQPSELYPMLEKHFFDPSFNALHALVSTVLPEEADHEERVICVHGLIGMILKFLEGQTIILQRLGWNNYQGRGVEKVAQVLSKRAQGFLGLPMEAI
ncbi:CerR family C-terminal domain-containing protein [Pseudodesulfovibrio cashew]|nr:CerR family C-terminal domain-containing protein [Pseudodesulfovibrio cashew]